MAANARRAVGGAGLVRLDHLWGLQLGKGHADTTLFVQQPASGTQVVEQINRKASSGHATPPMNSRRGCEAVQTRLARTTSRV
jgi:hypothetical protein